MWRKNKWRVSTVALIIAVILLAPVAVSCSAPDAKTASQKPPAPLVGRIAPDFTLRDLDGNQVRLSELRGKAIFLNFWASW